MENYNKELLLKTTTDIFNNLYKNINLLTLHKDYNKTNDVISDAFVDLYNKISKKLS